MAVKSFKVQAPEGCFQKIIQTLPPNFITGLIKSCIKFYSFCLVWMKVSKIKQIFIKKFKSV